MGKGWVKKWPLTGESQELGFKEN
ncbi:hypothetical protein [Cyanophage S-TIM5]|uniref:Uncharacterized protein n=1 Tax=Cyanophage S-TIM5 TaxID=1137745 RepID=H6WG35_9CAUD|nr:hypothetical protein F417_gp002 [Cyanophage S-TIM5]AEZ65582.1 hypothetical protein [Cyanophage S-TIM5]